MAVLKFKDENKKRISIPCFSGSPGNDGAPGAKGDPGSTFTPSVSSTGVISWTNNGNLPNPSSVDLAAAVVAALPEGGGGGGSTPTNATFKQIVLDIPAGSCVSAMGLFIYECNPTFLTGSEQMFSTKIEVFAAPNGITESRAAMGKFVYSYADLGRVEVAFDSDPGACKLLCTFLPVELVQ